MLMRQRMKTCERQKMRKVDREEAAIVFLFISWRIAPHHTTASGRTKLPDREETSRCKKRVAQAAGVQKIKLETSPLYVGIVLFWYIPRLFTHTESL
jgi:hypothetical protein